MAKIWALGRTTLQEMLRERFFLVVLFIAAIMLALSFLLGALSFAEQRKILTDFGFLSIQIALLGVSIFAGAFLISKEVEKQTCLLILSRPVSRPQFLLGKILGVLGLNTLLLLFLSVLLFFLLGLAKSPQQLVAFAEICLSLWFESAIVLGCVIAFSLVVRPVLALTAGVMVFLLGHWLNDLSFFAEKSKDAFFIQAVKVLHWMTPNLFKMNWKSSYYLENGIPAQNVLWMLTHSLGWVVLLILISNALFRRKDIV
ncbi:ABC transporter permease [Bdellovibrio reynosensis]|uniref:ABC transporter permease subunit n=1 Tax=Bdellovibrio reynosensis TaxID=2835041 RepID=A0ABY4CDB9_9BACT|nr:ABC transporter permease subunit [Bdellovibrio reynosensis]UOF02937.1 ABC transporter permease subunit [Bdellovibrio reynosensis]